MPRAETRVLGELDDLLIAGRLDWAEYIEALVYRERPAPLQRHVNGTVVEFDEYAEWKPAPERVRRTDRVRWPQKCRCDRPILQVELLDICCFKCGKDTGRRLRP